MNLLILHPGQGGKDFPDHGGDFGIEMHGQVIDIDNVDIALHEFAETSGLRPFAAPDLLHLVTLEREDKLVKIHRDIARHWHCLIEMQRKTRLFFIVGVGLKTFQNIYFLIRIAALGGNHVKLLHRRGFDGAKTVALEDGADMVEPLLLHPPHLWQPFRKPADRFGFIDLFFVGHQYFAII